MTALYAGARTGNVSTHYMKNESADINPALNRIGANLKFIG